MEGEARAGHQAMTIVDVASAEEFEQGVRRALDRLGITLAELRNQARLQEFQSEEARMTWFILSPLVDAA